MSELERPSAQSLGEIKCTVACQAAFIIQSQVVQDLGEVTKVM